MTKAQRRGLLVLGTAPGNPRDGYAAIRGTRDRSRDGAVNARVANSLAAIGLVKWHPGIIASRPLFSLTEDGRRRFREEFSRQELDDYHADLMHGGRDDPRYNS